MATSQRISVATWLSPTESAVLTRFADRVRAHYGDRVSRIVLFGSRARREEHEESDLDVAVIPHECQSGPPPRAHRPCNGSLPGDGDESFALGPVPRRVRHLAPFRPRRGHRDSRRRDRPVSAEDRRQNVRLEQEAGTEALSAARALVEKGLYRRAMSRAYYALFHHVRALPYPQGLEPSPHEGPEHLFGLHWVKPGKVDAAGAKLLAAYKSTASNPTTAPSPSSPKTTWSRNCGRSSASLRPPSRISTRPDASDDPGENQMKHVRTHLLSHNIAQGGLERSQSTVGNGSRYL